jgi:uncharacterized protein (DUF2141 family)
MWRDLAAAVIALAVASGVAGPQPAGTGAVEGAVVDVTGQPIPGATIRISNPRTSFDTSVTAADGRFQVGNLAPARYTVAAIADGYVEAEYGAFQPGDPGVPVLALARQKVSNLVITLRKSGAISGQLTDDHGDPVAGHVSILAPGPQGMTTATAGSTDGAGRYRFGDLPPGSFAVLAVPDPSPGERRAKDAAGVERVMTLAPTFYPSATNVAAAALVRLAGNDEASAIDIRLQPQPATSVEIAVTTAGGRALDRMQAVLLSDDDRGPARAQWAQDPDASAKTTMTGVVAGQYRLVVSGSERPAAASVPFSQEWAVRHVFVDGVTAVAIPVLLELGATLECRATMEGDARPGGMTGGRVPIRLRWIDGDLPKALERGPDVLILSSVESTSIPGIAPGRYIIQMNDDNGVTPKSLKGARINGDDVLDLAIELRGGERTAVSLTVTDRQSTVTGTVTGADGRPRLDVAVVIFPKDSRYWIRGTRRILVTRPDTSGGYEFTGLPAGEYIIGTVAERPPDDVIDAQWLNGLASSGVRLAVVDGQRHVQDLKLGSGLRSKPQVARR